MNSNTESLKTEVYVILKPKFGEHGFNKNEVVGFKIDSVRQTRPKGKTDGIVMALSLTLPKILFDPKLEAKVEVNADRLLTDSLAGVLVELS